ncbi:MAG: DUF302 domain-containing protein [Deltaproteobacteria bacterium]|nr:DUF302 domain-containing protein [Deltaproteobacteria bacterium]
MKEEMVLERTSPVGIDETLEKLRSAVEKANWVVSDVKPLHKSVKKNGGDDLRPVHIMQVCNAQHASELLRNDETRFASAYMPCTISVYEREDGSVGVATVNMAPVGEALGGVFREVMSVPVAAQMQGFLDAL